MAESTMTLYKIALVREETLLSALRSLNNSYFTVCTVMGKKSLIIMRWGIQAVVLLWDTMFF